ncbi:MAG: Rab family GTPase [Promethearchaeota archaeon]
MPPPTSRPYTHLAKTVVVGDAAVGKTSLLVRYVEGIFDPKYLLTIGVDFFLKDVVIDNRLVRLQIWDTGGQEEFGPIRRLYYRGAKGVLLVYDKSNPQSFQRLDYWLKEIKQGCGNVPIILIGNKADLKPAITTEEGQQYAKEQALTFIETSAKTNLNTKTPFSTLAQLIIKYFT